MNESSQSQIIQNIIMEINKKADAAKRYNSTSKRQTQEHLAAIDPSANEEKFSSKVKELITKIKQSSETNTQKLAVLDSCIASVNVWIEGANDDLDKKEFEKLKEQLLLVKQEIKVIGAKNQV